MYSKMLVTALVNCLCSVDVEAFIPRKLIQIMLNFREREWVSVGFSSELYYYCLFVHCSNNNCILSTQAFILFNWMHSK